VAGVVRVHAELAAKKLPKVSSTPVVIVAVYWALAARLPGGVKITVSVRSIVAILSVHRRSTGPVKVKVEPSMVAAFMAWLKMAVAMALGQAPLAGSR
jgi:hypothetical protein